MNFNSKIGLGTVQFGINYGISNNTGQTTQNEIKEILGFAIGHGLNLIDTAASYGNSEEILGQNDMQQFQIVSKFMPPSGTKTVKQQFRKSISDLRVSSLYGYLAHRPLDLISNRGTWEELKNLKKKGLVNKIGFSLNTPLELHALLETGFNPDLIQVPYSILDRRFESSMIQLSASGCEIHSRSTFLQGLVFMNPNLLPSFFDEVKPILIKLQRSTSNLSGTLLNFVAEKPFINKVIIGVNSLSHLKNNLNSIILETPLFVSNLQISENILMPSQWPKN